MPITISRPFKNNNDEEIILTAGGYSEEDALRALEQLSNHFRLQM
jgi:hypothetical protein